MMRNIRQNLFFAFAYNALGIGHAPLLCCSIKPNRINASLIKLPIFLAWELSFQA
jgi:cation transport ATPase